MINQKFRYDILGFYKQFSVGAERAKHIKPEFKPGKVYICGMGGSSFFAEIINNLSLYHFKESAFIRPLRGYKVPDKAETDELYFVISHSGNTEESLEALRVLKLKGAKIIIITNGGQLLKIAEDEKIPQIIIPGGTQPRLATGYFIGAIGQVFEDAGLWPKGAVKDLVSSTLKLNQFVDEDLAQQLANKIAPSPEDCRVPIIYGQEETEGVARAAKIKFNENCKIQSSYNFFPEVNHNEMVGFTKMIMSPMFIFLNSNLSSPRNNLRVTKFIEVLKLKEDDYFVYNLPGKNLITNTFAAYVFVDLITVYLAAKLNIDPEPVEMVERFKAMLG